MPDDLLGTVNDALEKHRGCHDDACIDQRDGWLRALVARCEQAEADLAALRQRHAEAVEAAFKAGYHCNWVKAERRYIFDPEMKPGDPDGAYAAWLASTAKARLT